MSNALQAAYRYGTAILFLAVLVQFGAAGYGAFAAADHTTPLAHKSFDHGFDFHSFFGGLIVVAGLVLVVIAVGAKLEQRRVVTMLGVPLLSALAFVLAVAGEKHPVVGIFHPIVAVLVFGLTGYLAHSAFARRAAAA